MGMSGPRAIVVLTGMIIAVLTGLGARLYWVQVASTDRFQEARQRQSTARAETESRRRDLFALNGAVLGTSDPVWSLAAIPEKVGDPGALAGRLSVVLRMPAARIAERLAWRTRDGRLGKFVWLLRRLDPAQVQAVRALADPALLLEQEFRRVYPEVETLCHVLGFTDIDDFGLEGIERAAETWLAPTRQWNLRMRDARGRVVERIDDGAAPPVRGDLYLTVDLAFQRILDEEMRAAFQTHRPEWACAIAIDPRTGEILGWTVLPAFDPNAPAAARGAERRNRALTDPYEPGSLVKPLVVAGALQRGVVTPGRTFDCGGGRLRVPGRTIHDHKPFGTLTVTEIIVNSSNVGAVRIGMEMGKEAVHSTLKSFGLGRRTGIELPAEGAGRLKPLREWSAFTLSSAPIGYELMATPLQMVRAYCAIANGGLLVRPRLIHEVLDEGGFLVHRPESRAPERILSESVAAQVRRMLVETVQHGTARAAEPEGLPAGGKTGTTQILENGVYRRDRHIASFVGFAPAEDPRICLAVVFAAPQGESYGGRVSAPVFGKVVSRGWPVLERRQERIRDRRRMIRVADLDGAVE